MKARLIDLELCVHHSTEKAVLVSNDGNRAHAVWLPKSPLEFEGEIVLGGTQIVTVPELIATEKGLV